MLIEPLRVDTVHQELLAQGEIPLQSFSALQLASVSATSPLRGLLASSEMVSLNDADVVSGMVGALRGLAEQGLVEPMVANGDGPSGQSREIVLPLGGQLAMVVAIRRQPALIGVLTVASLDGNETQKFASSQGSIIGVLHGLAIEDMGIVGLLEESVSPDSQHHFILSTPRRQAERMLGAGAALISNPGLLPFQTEGKRLALVIDIFVPQLTSPRHTQLVLMSSNRNVDGSGLMAMKSSAADSWDQTDPLSEGGSEWILMFEDSVRIDP